jgi:hypothetical protein
MEDETRQAEREVRDLMERSLSFYWSAIQAKKDSLEQLQQYKLVARTIRDYYMETYPREYFSFAQRHLRENKNI